jgi:glycosyltransferase involved in cell wall biosynthesis
MPNYELKCVDIVLATCNGERFVREQIESIQNCFGYSDWVNRLIIVDDYSEDETLKIVAAIASSDSKIEVLPGNIGQRRGVKGNFSYGLTLTTAPYVMLSDQDDVWMPHKMQNLLQVIRDKENECGSGTPLLVFSDHQVVDSYLNIIDSSFWHYQTVKPQWSMHLRNLLVQNVAPGSSLILNRALLKKALPIPVSAVMHDWWLILVARACGEVFWVDEALTWYRQHGGNLVGAKSLRSMFTLDILRKFKQAHINMYRLSAQARDLCCCASNKRLLASDIETLYALRDLPSYSLTSRVWLIAKATVRKNNLPRNLGLLILMCLPPCRSFD